MPRGDTSVRQTRILAATKPVGPCVLDEFVEIEPAIEKLLSVAVRGEYLLIRGDAIYNASTRLVRSSNGSLLSCILYRHLLKISLIEVVIYDEESVGLRESKAKKRLSEARF